MILRVLALILVAAPLAAQQTQPPSEWPSEGWGSEGWTAAPLDDLPKMDLGTGTIEALPDTPGSGSVLEMYDTPIADGIGFDAGPIATPEIVVAAATGGAVLRGLDKVSGDTIDLILGPGETGRFGRLSVTLGECRYPVDNPASDAFAYLTIFGEQANAPLFSGWMLASSPALNPLDHARYDVWVLRCNKS